MKLPAGCWDKSGSVVKPNKAVDGLQQSGSMWAKPFVAGVLVVNVGME